MLYASNDHNTNNNETNHNHYNDSSNDRGGGRLLLRSEHRLDQHGEGVQPDHDEERLQGWDYTIL